MRIRGWKAWAVAGVAMVAVLATAGPFIYIHYIQGKAPPPLSLGSESSSSPTSSGAASSGSVEGVWNVATGSQVGYRVKETLFGQSNEAVGRTTQVTGSITVAGQSVTAASFTVDMASVASDEVRRDNQFRGRIMQASTYPTGTFTLTKPIALGVIPADGVTGRATATGELTLHGVTREVAFDLTGVRTGGSIKVNGSIPITFADYKIANPSFGPAQTGDTGTLEFLLVFAKA